MEKENNRKYSRLIYYLIIGYETMIGNLSVLPGRGGAGHSILTVLLAEYTDGCPHRRHRRVRDHSLLPVLVAEYTDACLHLCQSVWESSRAGGRALALAAAAGADRDLWRGGPRPSSGSMSLSLLMMYGDSIFQAVGAMVKQSSLVALAEASTAMSVQSSSSNPARWAVMTSAVKISPARRSLYNRMNLQADLDTNMMMIVLATQSISISANTPVVDSKKSQYSGRMPLMIASPRLCLHNKSL